MKGDGVIFRWSDRLAVLVRRIDVGVMVRVGI